MHNIIELDQELPDPNRISLDVIKSNAISPVLSEEDYSYLSVEVFLELQEYQRDRDFHSRVETLKANLTQLRAKVDQILFSEYGIPMEQ